MQGSVPKGSTRPLAALGVAQFLGAFVDYAWKLAITVLLQRGADAAGAQEVAELVTVAFVLPLAAGALPAMGIADRFSNRSLLVATKALEVGIRMERLVLGEATSHSTVNVEERQRRELDELVIDDGDELTEDDEAALAAELGGVDAESGCEEASDVRDS